MDTVKNITKESSGEVSPWFHGPNNR